MRSFLFLLLAFLSILFAHAQREILVAPDDDGWAYLNVLDESGEVINLTDLDPDFFESWNDQSVGDYFSPLSYDGPPFTLNQRAPFFAGNIPGIEGGLPLVGADGTIPPASFFLKVIDGGTQGYQNLDMRLLAKDGAVMYLNGNIIGGVRAAPPTGGSLRIFAPGDGVTFEDLPLEQLPSYRKTLRPGPNLFAIAVGRVEDGESLGFKVEISGEPGLPPVTRVDEYLVGNQLHLRWATAEPQKTLVRLRDLETQAEVVIEGDSALRSHHFTRTLPAGSSYTWSILKPDGEVWDGHNPTGTVTVPPAILFEEQSDGWFYLQVRDAAGSDIDPSISDPDFFETWYRHVPGGNSSTPFESADYDGPAFQPATLPIHYGADDYFPNAGTVLTAPTGGEAHTLWLLKPIQVDGPGYLNPKLFQKFQGGVNIYLNGRRVDSLDANTPDPGNPWLTFESGFFSPFPNRRTSRLDSQQPHLLTYTREQTCLRFPSIATSQMTPLSGTKAGWKRWMASSR
jgi:hypothetical protein